MVWLNSHNVRDLRTPFGGVKASGLGHEGGYRSIDFYTDQQAVHVSLGVVHTPPLRRSLAPIPEVEPGRGPTLTTPPPQPPPDKDDSMNASPTTPPDIIRAAYAELIVTDLAASRAFYVDVLGLWSRTKTTRRSTCAPSRSTCTIRWCCGGRAGRRPRRPRLPGAVAARGHRRRRLLPRTRRPRRAAPGRRDPRHRRGRAGGGPDGFPGRVLLRRRACRTLHPPLRRARRRRDFPARPLQRDDPRRGAAREYHEALGFTVSEDIQDAEEPPTRRGCTASPPCTTSP